MIKETFFLPEIFQCKDFNIILTTSIIKKNIFFGNNWFNFFQQLIELYFRLIGNENIQNERQSKYVWNESL